jgi:rfaE bifunctional protein nucleotidyltransferase chain/domain
MRIIWTNGCFDILHRGHIELFEYAKSLGDYLVVGIDTDERVRQLKGSSRPINNLKDRKYMLESIKHIHEVVSFDSDEELVTQLMLSKAQTMVVGSDYRNKCVIGSPFIKTVKFFDRVEGYSTTSILEVKK